MRACSILVNLFSFYTVVVLVDPLIVQVVLGRNKDGHGGPCRHQEVHGGHAGHRCPVLVIVLVTNVLVTEFILVHNAGNF